VKQKLRTLEELEKTWWWRHKGTRHDEPGGTDWSLVEESARNYELLRRSPSGKQFKKTFPQLIPDEKRIIFNLWRNWEKGTYRHVRDRKLFGEKGWTPIYENQHRQWNLRLEDKKLTDEFIREIRLLREIQKIPTPRRNKGEKRRGVSWKLVEMLDRKLNRIGSFDGSERHTLSDARKRAGEYCIQYEHALAEWLKGSANPDSEVEKPDGDYGTAHAF
jgi:hypothetical protein